jgi:hypothetical protein
MGITLDGESGHFHKRIHGRCCLQKPVGLGKGGAHAKSPEITRNRDGGAPFQPACSNEG